jgi:transcriptional regulator with XRE-family HTH domain
MGEDFGDVLKRIRKQRGYTLEQMAGILGTTKQSLSRYERGERTPKITIAARFADLLGVELEDLIGYEYHEEDPDEMYSREMKQHIPQTKEAKIIAYGIDQLTDEERQRALNMLRIMFPEQADDIFRDYFEEVLP